MGRPRFIDHEDVAAIPREALDLISDAMDDPDYDLDGPCCWLDPITKRCLHYEHRPTICREFEMGGVDCRGWRERR